MYQLHRTSPHFNFDFYILIKYLTTQLCTRKTREEEKSVCGFEYLVFSHSERQTQRQGKRERGSFFSCKMYVNL